MGPKARQDKKVDHRSGLQTSEPLSCCDSDDSINPINASSNTEAFVSANSTDEFKDHTDGERQLLDSSHALSEAGSSTSCLQSDLSLNGSASETNADESDTKKPDAKVRRTKEATNKTFICGGCSASERLMQQIDSLLRDSEFTATCKPTLELEEFELKHIDDNVLDPYLKLKTNPGTSETSKIDHGYVAKLNNVTEPGNDASHKVCESQTAEKHYESNSWINLAEADLFLTDDEHLGDFLNLIHHLEEICHKSKFQRQLCLNLKQIHDKPKVGKDELNVHEEIGDTASVPIKVDNLEDSIQETKREEIKMLLLSISVVLEKTKFSSALELADFLEVVEQMKMEIDQWHRIQNQNRISNEDKTVLNSAIGGAKSINDILVYLRTKPGKVLTELSKSLVIWQDFIETRAELEHELTLEQNLLNSIHTNVNCSDALRTKLEAEHDLKLIEDKLEDYSETLRSLRLCNRHLAEILDPSTLSSNRSQTGILACEIQDIRDSCVSLRSMLNTAADNHEMLSSSQLTSEPNYSSNLTYARMEKSAEDFDKLNIARLVLKMILLLFLILLLLLFVSYFEPHLYHPLNRFRLSVPIHVRHVGTYPPM